MKIHISNITYHSTKENLPNHLFMEVADGLSNTDMHNVVSAYIKKTTGYVAVEYSVDMDRIKANHPDLRGSFLCLGNWYNLYHKGSCFKLDGLLTSVSPSDKKTALKEIAQAREEAKKWVRHPTCTNAGLYEMANAQGDWDIQF